MPDFLAICEQAARAGGAVLLEWADRFSVREKAPSDLVTEADIASQEVVRSILLTAFPDHDFLSEEDPVLPAIAGQARDSARPAGQLNGRYRWIVDPLDGTTNYVHHVPEFAVSIALEQAGEVLVGCVFNPVAGECFTAVQGGGAFLNGRRLAVSQATELSHALVAASFPPKVEPGSRVLKDFAEVIVACQSVRRTGSAALNLCYVAAGRFDAYWARETKIWDVAAGSLLIREAGGLITGLDGAPFHLDRPQFISAATEHLHRQLRAIVG
ncbi:MAG TPA: inositol monophosphatase family protein [Pirellulales bacterium]|jgi:myo-inositol-1(or 4)-monophosphatase|nr:inositol monophosphatase family protein [Pirellulales bacterium]